MVPLLNSYIIYNPVKIKLGTIMLANHQIFDLITLHWNLEWNLQQVWILKIKQNGFVYVLKHRVQINEMRDKSLRYDLYLEKMVKMEQDWNTFLN